MNPRFRFLLGFGVLLNGILIVCLSGLTMELRDDVGALQQVLATKDDLVALSAPEVKFFHEEKCTGCHTERRFAGDHTSRVQIAEAVAHMQQLPDVGFSQQDLAKIHASLSLLRCAQCHGAEKLRLLQLRTPEERLEVIQRMSAKPGSGISPDEAQDVLRAYEQMLGF